MANQTAKAALRAAMLGNSAALRRTNVHITSFDVDVEVRGLMAGRAFDLKEACRNEDGEINDAKFYPALLIETLYVPGTDDLLFTRGDRDALLQWPSELMEQLATIAAELSGLGVSGYRAVEKNSDAAATPTTAATPTASPNAST